MFACTALLFVGFAYICRLDKNNNFQSQTDSGQPQEGMPGESSKNEKPLESKKQPNLPGNTDTSTKESQKSANPESSRSSSGSTSVGQNSESANLSLHQSNQKQIKPLSQQFQISVETESSENTTTGNESELTGPSVHNSVQKQNNSLPSQEILKDQDPTSTSASDIKNIQSAIFQLKSLAQSTGDYSWYALEALSSLARTSEDPQIKAKQFNNSLLGHPVNDGTNPQQSCDKIMQEQSNIEEKSDLHDTLDGLFDGLKSDVTVPQSTSDSEESTSSSPLSQINKPSWAAVATRSTGSLKSLALVFSSKGKFPECPTSKPNTFKSNIPKDSVGWVPPASNIYCFLKLANKYNLTNVLIFKVVLIAIVFPTRKDAIDYLEVETLNYGFTATSSNQILDQRNTQLNLLHRFFTNAIVESGLHLPPKKRNTNFLYHKILETVPGLSTIAFIFLRRATHSHLELPVTGEDLLEQPFFHLIFLGTRVQNSFFNNNRIVQRFVQNSGKTFNVDFYKNTLAKKKKLLLDLQDNCATMFSSETGYTKGDIDLYIQRTLLMFDSQVGNVDYMTVGRCMTEKLNGLACLSYKSVDLKVVKDE